jgi:hypothetical protein
MHLWLALLAGDMQVFNLVTRQGMAQGLPLGLVLGHMFIQVLVEHGVSVRHAVSEINLFETFLEVKVELDLKKAIRALLISKLVLNIMDILT